ncbi:lectin subunit alpha [Stomoxys calcitrans]|uniref:lectin subunit alpha n=1 Tax=Stomoxys calcitrans TaxID=35570 RepID=UPI0027E286B7|nr:lectin subunit alpha [Stomoxys calcitrans]
MILSRLQILSLSILCCGLIVAAVPQWQNSTDGRQYLIEGDQNYNWFKAFHECARRKLQLVEIDSKEKNQALIEVLKPLFGDSHNLWIGANDEYNRDKDFKRPFYWSSSGQPMTFSHWSSNNPDNDQQDEHCVHMWKSKPDYQWNDHHCDTPRFGFVCEEHHLKADLTKMMADKRKTATETSIKLYEEYHRQQKLMMEKLENSLKEIQNIETELKEQLHNIHTKLEFDINHALAQHQREANSVVDDRTKAIRNVFADLTGATTEISMSVSKEMERVKTVYDDIFSI